MPLLSGEGRRRQGEILEQAARLAEAGNLLPRLDPRTFTLDTVGDANEASRCSAPTTSSSSILPDWPLRSLG
jgi:hypothetical protein